jgi:hypothetical protein
MPDLAGLTLRPGFTNIPPRKVKILLEETAFSAKST